MGLAGCSQDSLCSVAGRSAVVHLCSPGADSPPRAAPPLVRQARKTAEIRNIPTENPKHREGAHPGAGKGCRSSLKAFPKVSSLFYRQGRNCSEECDEKQRLGPPAQAALGTAVSTCVVASGKGWGPASTLTATGKLVLGCTATSMLS